MTSVIDADRWDELADRALGGMLFHARQAPAAWMRDKVLAMHRQFAAHRTGPPTAEW